MNQQQIHHEINTLKKTLAIATRSFESAPEGHLRCEMLQGKYPQYYFVSKENAEIHAHGIYIKKEQIELARKLAQKEYDFKIITALKKQIRILENYQKGYDPDVCLSVYEHMPQAKKLLVMPYTLPNPAFVNQWYDQHPYSQNPFPIENGFTTDHGETVRSKSEKIIADKLFHKKIPYRYEAPLVLDNSRIIYPDFSLLNIRTRRTIYFEHFGMMDNPEYCRKALEKIEFYEKNGLHVGESFLYTMESSLKGINTQLLDSILNRHLL